MPWFHMEEDTSGLGPWSMTHQLFSFPGRVKMKDMFFLSVEISQNENEQTKELN